jgi:hypothetical protein
MRSPADIDNHSVSDGIERVRATGLARFRALQERQTMLTEWLSLNGRRLRGVFIHLLATSPQDPGGRTTERAPL